MIPIFRVSFAFLCLSWFSALASTQPGPAIRADRVAAHPDLRTSTMLRGHIPGWAVSANDQGAVAPGTPLHLTFVLSRSAELQASFTKLLADQQDPASPSYHQWLTPQQAGERYGPTQHDLDALTGWLGSQGFSVVESSPSRIFVNAVAPAATVANALATSFHTFSVSGRSRISATVDPSIPTAFASVVTSVSGLADTDLRPMHHGQAMAQGAQLQQNGVQPQYTTVSAHYITPGDFATIFDLKPIYNAGISGAGQKVAIIGRSRVASADITGFEANTGLAANVPNVIIPPTGADPGLTNDDDQSEATLDVERVLGTAPAIQADLVITSVAGGGLYRAASYEVETVLDPVMNISFGSCEVNAGASLVSQWDALFSVAASEGISVFVSAGDAGAAGCDEQFSTPPAYQFASINYLCASSYVTCVGGTELVEGPNSSQYWSSTNGGGLVSALAYIPEGAWNEPGNIGPYVAASGGGGASVYIPKPAWQTGIGVPADSARDVPDVSFPSASHDGYYGCYAVAGGDCSTGKFYFFYGTSAASPAIAGVTALLNQKTGGSQGNLNPLLYRLAAGTPSAFHDATPATINGTVCSIGSPSVCNNSTPGAAGLTGGLAGYALTTGYDQATGLGSLDVANFLNAAAAVPKSGLAPTVLTLNPNPTSISNTQTANFTASLTSKTAGTPTGTVQFYADGKVLGGPIAVDSSGVATVNAVPFPAAGNYYISAVYSGDSTYAPSTAAGYSLTVTGLSSTTHLAVTTTTLPVGTTGTFALTVSPASGSVVPTGVVRLVVNGGAYTVPLTNGAATSPPIRFSSVGSYTLTANYQGDSVFSPSSTSGTVAVQKLVSGLQLSDSAASIGIGGGISSYIVIPNISGSTAPAATGTIQLYSNGVALGAPFALPQALGLTAQGSSPANIFSTAGTYTITATYSGDANWTPATAPGTTLTVLSTPAYYQLSVSSPTMTFRAGDVGNNVNGVNVASELGFVGTVNLNCAVTYNGPGTPAGAPTCKLSSNTVTFPLGSSLSEPSLTINTTARSNIRASGLFVNGGSERGNLQPEKVVFCALLLCFVPLRRREWRALMILIVLAAGFNALSGCSGGSSTNTPSTPIGTSAGSYTVTVTASSTAAGAPVPSPATIALTIN
jgi:subtilase family serine protease